MMLFVDYWAVRSALTFRALVRACRTNPVTILLLMAFSAGCSSAPIADSHAEVTGGAAVGGSTSTASANSPDPASSSVPLSLTPLSQEQWRKAMSKTPIPKNGCFRASQPTIAWQAVPCGPPTPGAVVAPPTRELLVGNGNDLSTQPSSPIDWAEGSFPIVNNVMSVASVFPNGNQTPGDFELQLNTNIIPGATIPACHGAVNPANCQGWEQFLYSETSGQILIETWLFNYGPNCPNPWEQWDPNTCMQNSQNFTVPTRPGVSSLGSLIMTATAGTSDVVQLYTGDGNIYVQAQASQVNLGGNGNWTQAEFNVFGDGSSSLAQFNNGATTAVQLLTNGSNVAPLCPQTGTTGETNNLSLIGSCCRLNGATPGIFFTQSNVTNQAAYPCPANPQPEWDGFLATAEHNSSAQTDLFTIDRNGELSVTSSVENEPWSLPAVISPATFEPGAPLAASPQFGIPQTDLFAVDKYGNLNVAWAYQNLPWGGPSSITTNAPFPGWTYLATSQQFGIPQTDVFAIDNNGNLDVYWVYGGGGWQGPQAMPNGHLFPPGAPIAASQEFGASNQTVVFAVDNTGRLVTYWVFGQGAWAGPAAVSGPGVFSPGAYVVAAQQVGLTQTDVFAIDTNGNLEVYWTVNALPPWYGPLTISSGGPFFSGQVFAVSPQFGLTQTDVFAIDKNGNPNVFWVDGGGSWGGPQHIDTNGAFPPGAPVAASRQFGLTQTDLFAIDTHSLRTLFDVAGGGNWNDYLEIP
jgi:hypothetical protein